MGENSIEAFGFVFFWGACHASGVAPGALLQSTPKAWDLRVAPWRILAEGRLRFERSLPCNPKKSALPFQQPPHHFLQPISMSENIIEAFDLALLFLFGFIEQHEVLFAAVQVQAANGFAVVVVKQDGEI